MGWGLLALPLAWALGKPDGPRVPGPLTNCVTLGEGLSFHSGEVTRARGAPLVGVGGVPPPPSSPAQSRRQQKESQVLTNC